MIRKLRDTTTIVALRKLQTGNDGANGRSDVACKLPVTFNFDLIIVTWFRIIDQQ